MLPHLRSDVGVVGLQSGFGGAREASSLGELAEAYVHRLRQLDAHGPYRLLGWSFGGLLAHEMAVQLQHAGASVDFLAVVDIFAGLGFGDGPDPADTDSDTTDPEDTDPEDTDTEDDAALLSLLLRAAGRDVEDPLLARAVAAADLPEIVRLVRGSSGALGSIGVGQLSAVLAQIRHHATLGARHRPRHFAGDLELVVADLDPPGRLEVDPASRWRPFVGGTVRSRRVVSRHDDLLDAEVTARWAPAVLGRLPGDRPDPRSAGR